MQRDWRSVANSHCTAPLAAPLLGRQALPLQQHRATILADRMILRQFRKACHDLKVCVPAPEKIFKHFARQPAIDGQILEPFIE